MIDDLLAPPRPRPSPPVFDDPRGRRRRIVTAVGVMVGLLCLYVLAMGVGVLYVAAETQAPVPAGAVHTTSRR
ncbi:hypothetical protein ACIRBY_32025 [Streptomyces sp. NPDC096136]|uniref:hypothetical protein n=1 Tax=Streptomyces sp. NPDC096136 TaxID=3366076 RepID=UPI00382C17B6